MTEFRSLFHSELNQLEVLLLDMSELAEVQINNAVEALLQGDAELAHRVVLGDREIDRLYVEVERRWHEVMARQTPVASDLRLMSLILQAGHSLERMGDQASNIAKIVEATAGLPTNRTILLHIREMRSIVVPMVETAMEALVKRDLNLALRLPELDDPADWLNRNMWKEGAAWTCCTFCPSESTSVLRIKPTSSLSNRKPGSPFPTRGRIVRAPVCGERRRSLTQSRPSISDVREHPADSRSAPSDGPTCPRTRRRRRRSVTASRPTTR